MPDTHDVDQHDQDFVGVGIPDRSELTTFYAEAKKEELGPWMQENERQEAMAKERDKVQISLRGSALRIGLFISLPVVLGIIIGQILMSNVDLKNAVPILFLVILGILAFLGFTYASLKWVGGEFQKHNLKALPITLTTIVSMALLIPKTFATYDMMFGGLTGYGIGLASLLGVGIVVAGISVFVWSAPRLSGLIKLLVLVLFLGASVTFAYLVQLDITTVI